MHTNIQSEGATPSYIAHTITSQGLDPTGPNMSRLDVCMHMIML
jgi:hypothetical protein